ncbi:MAG TPA: thiamine pyrophosphate-dependent enzyme [Sumerlaeia bacterium]|nr:thiamine pyrophosphate-dependent enzyme [Sumerlaeia bacterium]
MTKSLMIDPAEMRKKGTLKLRSIPVNQYQKTVKDEVGNYTKDDFLAIYHDMAAIRVFENMLQDVKLKGSWRDVAYNHRGPGHLSIGQEAAAVGQAFLLDANDHIFGSHRSHGEILAKGLSALRKIEDGALDALLRNYMGGKCYAAVEKKFDPNVAVPTAASATQAFAMEYLIYGALAEIFGREAGLNRGMGGSMHAFFAPFGIYPNNAIVGGSGDISVGSALYKKINHKPGIVICNIGDASSACGPVWEGICLAAMDQYKTLWDEEHRGGLPLIINFMNNFYGMGGQPFGETMGFQMVARIGAGVNPDAMHAERIDGYNPLAVVDAVRSKRKVLEQGDGPVLLDTVTYRYSGHSPSDASSYREKSEVDAWREQDSIPAFAAALVEAGVAQESELDAIMSLAEERTFKIYQMAIDLEFSPRLDLMVAGCELEKCMFSNETREKMEEGREPEVLIPLEENPRVQQIARKSRTGVDENGKALAKAKVVSLRDALFEAVIHRFYTDPTLVAYGEENRDWGGAFAVYRGLTEALPYHRLFNTPISEGAIAGSAVGYGIEGGRVIAELMYCDFMGRAGDEIFNQLCKWQAMSGGYLHMPVVLRVSVGSKYGAQHSQDWTSVATHMPGLKVVFPATPYDAKGLMNAALNGTDPVVFFESQRIYDVGEEFVKGGVPEGYYEVPIGEPAVKREGKDLTILSIGATLYRARDAAKILEEKHGLSAELIDARSLVPFNYEKVIESVRKTRKILLTSDACERGSYLHTMASTISQLAYDELDAPPTVVGARNWITPPDELEEAFFPQPSDMLDAVNEYILPLKGHKAARVCSVEEKLRREHLGV